jgi:hypothetical protein
MLLIVFDVSLFLGSFKVHIIVFRPIQHIHTYIYMYIYMNVYIYEYIYIYSYIHMCIHCLGHFSLLTPPLPSPPLSSRQNLFCAFLQFCWRVEINNNKKDKAFLLVEIWTAIQRDSWHCFHVQTCYNPGWFISNWSLH